jgi:hypothetical protein
MGKHILYVGSQRTNDEPEFVIRKSYPDITIHFFGISKDSFNTRTNRIDFDIEAYTEKARVYIKEHAIDGVYFTTDLGSLVGAVLCEEFGFPGPSVIAAFHCFHKYYTRKFLPAPEGYSLFHIEQDFPSRKEYPFYIKAPYSAAGVLGYGIHSEKDLINVLPMIKKELPQMNMAINTFMSRYLPENMHDEAFQNVMVIEKYIDAPQLTIEGFVHNGEVNFTVITDTNFYPNSRLIDNFSMPTRLDDEKTSYLKEQAKKDVLTLGINNCFFNSEYWIMDDGYTLIEVNCRAASCFEYLYNDIFDYDVTRAGVELCLGILPKQIGLSDGFGGQFNVVTQYEGNSSDIFNYQAISPSKLSIKRPEHTQIRNMSDFGTVITQFELTGRTYEEIKSIADDYRQKNLKRI